MDRSLKSVINDQKLKFIFVGGKGGVGKTTTSSAIALAISKLRKKVLILSTDPAHNLADAFNQQLSNEPTLIAGTENLWGMEIDPQKTFEQANLDKELEIELESLGSLNDLITKVPGIDEFTVIMDLIKLVKEDNFDVVVFDTAPTGHTLKLLGFPSVFQKILEKILNIKDKIGAFTNLLGSDMESKIKSASEKISQFKENSETLLELLQNNEITTFIGVCIPEFLSVYETERLVQELATKNIDICNLVVNQIVFPENQCNKCLSRYKMQYKYIKQIFQLYDDFNISLMPLEDEEIRGIEKLTLYSSKLLQSRDLPDCF